VGAGGAAYYLDHERQKVQPRPAAEPEPEADKEAPAMLDLLAPPASQPVPMSFGIHLMEPPPNQKKRKKTPMWPTATEEKTQLSLFD
jgi:hypothetical protein